MDWGLGHATRCVPIIKALLKNNNKVILGCTSLTEKILGKEFPLLDKIDLPEYAITYSNHLPVWFKLLLQYPHIKSVIRKEHHLLNQLIASKQIEIVISDNRYGLHHQKIKSIMICHQMNLVTPFFNKIVNHIHARLLRMFTEIWVPDFEEKAMKLAGELSENKSELHCKYIGPLSRLEKIYSELKYDYLFLLSGPEPAQTNLLKAVISKANQVSDKKIVIVSGSNPGIKFSAHITFINLPGAKQLSELIAQSKTIVCRSGYSTLMDLYTLEKKDLILIPTKGQTEQEYLADYWKEKFKGVVLKESEVNQYHF